MIYRVEITERAQRDLAHLYQQIDAVNSKVAQRWYAGLKRAILSLEKHPLRCPPAPENRRLRHLLYGRRHKVYCVLFRVSEKQQAVEIVHIRHARRGALTGQ